MLADVAILGGGPAGAATALALRRRGVARVVLIDRPSARPFPIGESAAPAIGPLLRRLGLPDGLDAHGHLPYRGNLSVWGSERPRRDEFLFRASGHGWHLDRARFDGWLLGQALAAGARMIGPARLVALGAGRLRVEGPDGTAEIAATVLVDATGRRAATAAPLGIARRRLDRLVALAARTMPAPGLAGLSLVEAVPEGWWYAAPVPGGAVISLMTDADQARALLDPAAYRLAWQRTAELGRMTAPPTSRPIVFDAATRWLASAARPGWLAVGDALAAFDPLSASGLAGALDDALAAADAITAQIAGPAPDAILAYAARAERMLSRYLAEREAIYRRERRWPAAPFWTRRAFASPP